MLPTLIHTNPPTHTLDTVAIKNSDVIGLPKKLDTGKSMKPDEMYLRLKNELENPVADSLSTRSKHLVTQSRLPKGWKNV